MQRVIVVVLLVAALAAALYWQVSSNGKLKAQNKQLVVSVEELAQADRDNKARVEKLDKRRAETVKYANQLEKETNELRDKLKAASDCDSGPFSADFINWVLEYRSQD